MRTRNIVVWGAALVLLVAGSAAAQGKGNGAAGKVKCTDPSIEITIVPTTSSALAGDSKGSVYTNGVDGVSATIFLCGVTNSTYAYDAFLNLATSTRSIAFTFPPAIAGSNIVGPSPVWANGRPFLAKPVLHVRNLLWGRMNGQLTFTTRVPIEFLLGPGNTARYDLRYQPLVVDALVNAPPFPDTNLPSETSAVTVQDIPGTCRTNSTGTLDSWIVTVDAPFLGTLNMEDRAKTHSGQYTMPFQFLIKAKTCLPF